MILSCNSCEKKFVVPDQAITSVGRVVQCGSCGNKWKQFPNTEEKKIPIRKVKKINTIPKPKKSKPKRKVSKKKREIDLYSPEYLAKKHGINLHEIKDKPISKNKASFSFYGSFIIFIVFIIIFSRSLYFFQEFIVQKLPFTELYLKYFFENISNLFEIWKNLISNY